MWLVGILAAKIVIFLVSDAIYASHVCGLCPAGYFIKSCANQTTPVCERCPEGTYISGRNNYHRCQICSACRGSKNQVISACNATHDTVCRCQEGYFWDTGTLYCAECKSCGRGRGVVRNCTHNHNTVCRKCEKEKTYSPGKSRTDGCLMCKNCPAGQTVSEKCTRRKDTVCEPVKPHINKNQPKLWPEWTEKPKTAHPTTGIVTDIDISEFEDQEEATSNKAFHQQPTEPSLEKNATLKLVVIVVGCCVVFAFVAIVVVIISRRRKQKRKTSAPPTSTTSTASTARPNIQTNRLSTAPLVQSGSTDKLFRDVPYSLTDHLSRHLNPKGRWKSLAGNLGFSNLDIENFNLQPNSATSSMLYDWGQRRESTLYTLYETLVKMKWVTEAEIVKKYL
ncbi:tumor necrosis factor receptor superfamily member 16 isoform X2 [Nematostella vectensis]|uniref:tumor necrosis factor receptor superfamily member 16 isoform X2 n=1 Tax=Nematostella vectensis TaxID=45351 RepID=UPI0020777308|nr:tumor necrosis factor receptor superfamily member 16 isoform X2 [Nematostella vectensis]